MQGRRDIGVVYIYMRFYLAIMINRVILLYKGGCTTTTSNRKI